MYRVYDALPSGCSSLGELAAMPLSMPAVESLGYSAEVPSLPWSLRLLFVLMTT